MRLADGKGMAGRRESHGGDVTVVHLPEIGIHGNTHFLFSDLNNLEIADLMSNWLTRKRAGLTLVSRGPGGPEI